MLMVKTRVAPSSIHGVGVFACEPVEVGQTVWQFEPAFDRVITDEELDMLPGAFRSLVGAYGYRSIDLGGVTVLSCDHARFLNHSDDPNTEEKPFTSLACRRIEIGDEITCDYGVFCSDGKGFDS